MKVVTLALLAVIALPRSADARHVRSAADISPVSRVVELLKDLAKKIKAEGKQEEDLYESFVCWAERVISTKTASNEKAKSRTDSLEAYLEDIEAGRVEFTSERTDLEKEVADLKTGIETAEAQRAKEHEDYLAAKDEMTKAIVALEDALKVLREASDNIEGEQEGLLSVRSRATEGFSQLARESSSLRQALKLGQGVLSAADTHFLSMIFSGDVPEEKDWEKLNRKATFKMKYKVRSSNIIGVLSKLLKTIKADLEEAEDKEKEAAALHEKLMESKGEALDTSQEALTALSEEGGAQGLVKAEVREEIADLAEQMENDKKFIEEAEKSLEEKKAEWKERKAARLAELEAISKAIAILYSDDARDTFKRSFESHDQAMLFLQVKRAVGSAELAERQRAAGRVLLSAAASSRANGRLYALAAQLSAGTVQGRFDKVIEAIDEMIEMLKAEEKEDMEKNDKCKEDRAKDTSEAAEISHAIDGLTDDITKLEEKIEEIVGEIEEKEQAIVDLEEEMKKAKIAREEENAEWQKTDADDSEALVLVERATEVLSEFYSALLQKGGKGGNKEEPEYKMGEVVAGEAPPPPPKTWEGDVEKKSTEGGSIIEILKLIASDIKNDLEVAKAAEDKAQAAHEEFMKTGEEQLEELKSSIVELKDAKGKHEEEMKAKEEEKVTKKEALDVVVQRLKDAEKGCDWVATHIEMRRKNRQIEIDGLTEAKAILLGAKSE